jgi:prepilin-type N-terminal cleavage/methylation domain-containing protein
MHADRGFSLVELLVVMSLGLVLSAMAVLPYQTTAATTHADANLRIVEGQLRFARDAATSQRRPFEVRITAPNILEVVRHNIPSGTTVVSTARLEHGMHFAIVGSTPDTPDGFGRETPVDFGGATSIRFTADGMCTDAAGNPVNGTIYLARAGEQTTSRALTVFGLSARVRSYRWNGSAWTP